MVFALLSMAVAGSCRDSGRQAREEQVQVAAEPSPSFFRSRASWQKLIESVDYEFERRKSTLQYSLEQSDGDCEIHLTRRQDLQGSGVERTAMRNTVGISVSE